VFGVVGTGGFGVSLVVGGGGGGGVGWDKLIEMKG